MSGITLTSDQQNALDKFIAFLLDPIETVFVLEGYSGTGKSTLVQHILEYLPKYQKTWRLINPKADDYDIELTATTNKAAEALRFITGSTLPVSTIHSLLGLRVETDFRTNTTQLVPTKRDRVENRLLFIDEASYVDSNLLDLVFKCTRNCKIIFIGDPAQLTPVKSGNTPVFESKFMGARLEQVVRQAEGNPIIALSTQFRHTVNTGDFFSFIPDGQVIQHHERADFNALVQMEFTRPNWKYQDSKFLAWTNQRVVEYNHWIRDQVAGDPDFQAGDYAICNKFVGTRSVTIKTDQMVQITGISGEMEQYGVRGKTFTVDHRANFFMPNSRQAKLDRLKQARADEDFHLVEEMESRWIDLRAAYACTVNKAQGSTFNKVFIDLDDIKRCTNGNQIARLLYVAVSRAKYQVVFTGDIC